MKTALTQCLFQACADRNENYKEMCFFFVLFFYGFVSVFTGGNRQWNFISRGSRGRMGAPSSLSTQGGAVPAAAAPFHPAKHWCLVVPLSWMALISALSWGRLIPTVLTLSPVLHCDTGHRREAQHPHFSKFQHHLWCHWIPIWSQRKKKTKKKTASQIQNQCWSQLYIPEQDPYTFQICSLTQVFKSRATKCGCF